MNDYIANTNPDLRIHILTGCIDPRVDEGRPIIAFHLHPATASELERWHPVFAHGLCTGCLRESKRGTDTEVTWTVVERPVDFDPTDLAGRDCGSLHCLDCNPDGPGEDDCPAPGCWECLGDAPALTVV